MTTFFTVDRGGGLTEGVELVIQRHTDVKPVELQQHVDFTFPDGVSRHGNSFFLSNGSRANIASPAIEILFEYVRRAHFPERPSRFASHFGVDSLTAAVAFNERYGEGSGRLYAS